ncbi:aldo/keto reductase [candidate division KSB1 bacterium]|nr:aldo/keto reductase [candidate division KSB1 bacterium]
MKMTRLGQTELMVSGIAMGCWALSGVETWGAQDETEAVRTVHAALDAGITLFDTAEAYGDGESERLLGKALVGNRNGVVIASKVRPANLAHAELIAACERSLRNLRTDTIDLYQVHWANPDVPIGDTIEALQQLQKEGKIRAIGVSNFGVRDLQGFASLSACETNQLPYSLLWRAVESKIVPECLKRGVGILAYSPLAQGLLTGKFESADAVPEERRRTRFYSSARPLARHGDTGCEEEVFLAIAEIRSICREIGRPMAHVALAWLLHQPGVTSVLAGARRPEQIRENAAAEALVLDLDTLQALDRATQAVKKAIGENPDMWQSQSRYR